MSSNHDDRKGSYGTLPLSAHSANKKYEVNLHFLAIEGKSIDDN